MPRSRVKAKKFRQEQRYRTFFHVSSITRRLDEIVLIIRPVEEAESIEDAMKEIMLGAKGEEGQQISWIAAFRDSAFRKQLLLGCILQVNKPLRRDASTDGKCSQASQQLAGINTLMYYSASIVREARIGSTEDDVWIAAGLAFINFASTMIGFFLIERIGRRKLLLSSLCRNEIIFYPWSGLKLHAGLVSLTCIAIGGVFLALQISSPGNIPLSNGRERRN